MVNPEPPTADAVTTTVTVSAAVSGIIPDSGNEARSPFANVPMPPTGQNVVPFTTSDAVRPVQTPPELLSIRTAPNEA